MPKVRREKTTRQHEQAPAYKQGIKLVSFHFTLKCVLHILGQEYAAQSVTMHTQLY